MRQFAKVLLIGWFLCPLVFPSDETGFFAILSPSRSHWVPTPVAMRLQLFRFDAKGLEFVDMSSMKLYLDGKEITRAFLEYALKYGKVKWERTLSRLTLEASVPLAPGRHRWILSCRTKTNGRLKWWGDFTAYRPERATNSRARLEKSGGGIPPEDYDPPEVTICPRDRGFIHTNTPKFQVKWMDEASGVDISSAKVILDGNDRTTLFSPQVWGCEYKVPGSSPLKDGKHVLVVKIKDMLGNLAVKTSTFIVFEDSHRAPWPFSPTNKPHPLAHTHHQYQYYGGSAYFHHGIDIREPAYSPLYAPRGGKVVSLYWYGYKPYYFEVGIRDPNGFTWQFHHVHEPTVPQTVRDAYKNGTPIPAGTYIGKIVYWPVSAYGQRFHHVHMNVLDPDGNYVNPLNLILKTNDTRKPTIGDILFTRNNSDRALNSPGGPRPVLSGKIDIVAQAEDKIGNEPYQLTLFKMEWKVDELTGSKSHNIPFTTLWEFNNLPGGNNRFAHVHTIFQKRIYFNSRWHYTCGNYTCHRFYYNLTNTISSFPDPDGCWDTSGRDAWGRPLFPNGLYRVTVKATDDRGNWTTKSIDVEIRN